ncbi:translation initiation factor IF-2-like [Pyrgilauda ruficollis]|uniref:translation initiation factor IF-2-like n=1 Tax=Pyrgilauda ruficollis TaxID=221976 RepID=UPI001B886633|nr:translation initiation factor IF-2-like [Pyrgilauda ruficollis]
MVKIGNTENMWKAYSQEQLREINGHFDHLPTGKDKTALRLLAQAGTMLEAISRNAAGATYHQQAAQMTTTTQGGRESPCHPQARVTPSKSGRAQTTPTKRGYGGSSSPLGSPQTPLPVPRKLSGRGAEEVAGSEGDLPFDHAEAVTGGHQPPEERVPGGQQQPGRGAAAPGAPEVPQWHRAAGSSPGGRSAARGGHGGGADARGGEGARDDGGGRRPAVRRVLGGAGPGGEERSAGTRERTTLKWRHARCRRGGRALMTQNPEVRARKAFSRFRNAAGAPAVREMLPPRASVATEPGGRAQAETQAERTPTEIEAARVNSTENAADEAFHPALSQASSTEVMATAFAGGPCFRCRRHRHMEKELSRIFIK